MKEILIQQTSPLQQLEDLKKPQGKTKVSGEGFADLLQEAVQEVDQLHQASDQQVEKILSGDINDVHSAMIAMQKADVSFQMLMQVRNKLVEAYQEVMRMQV